MLRRLVGAIVAASSVAVVVFASSTSNDAATPQNPYAAVYANSLAGMKAPDHSLDRVLPPNADFGVAAPVVAAPQSKTCSQRCSTTCSKGCTTTRGCSSNCKRQSDGCGGSITRPPTTTTTSPVETSALLPSSKSPAARDFTARTVLNAQRALVIAGYEGVCVNGLESKEFLVALRDFQSKNGLVPQGTMTDFTWQAMRPMLARMPAQ